MGQVELGLEDNIQMNRSYEQNISNLIHSADYVLNQTPEERILDLF